MDTLDTLSRLVNKADVFLATHWNSAPLHVPSSARDSFASILQIADIERLLSTTPLSGDLVRLFCDGQVVPRERYTEPVRTASHVEHDFVIADAVFTLFRSGATVLISALDRLWPSVGDFCAALAAELSHPVEAYAFITPAGHAGLLPHIDHEATFLLQLAGVKRWSLYPKIARHAERTEPVSVDREHPSEIVELRAGDVLYIPPGVPHAGVTGNDALSAHLNLSITLTSWRQALLAAVAALTDDEYFRMSLPPLRCSREEAVKRELRQRIDRLHAALAGLRPTTLYQSTSEWSGATPGRFAAPSAALRDQ